MNIARFLIRRVLAGIVVLWLVATVTFLLFFARPTTTVARQLAGREATPAVINQVINSLGLNQSIAAQYWRFLDQLLHGNLGYSYFTQEPVNTIIRQDLPPTISLVIGGTVLWLVVGLGVGIISATRARSLFDRASAVGVLIGISLPTFVIGEFLLLVVFVPLNQHGFHWIRDQYSGPSQVKVTDVILCETGSRTTNHSQYSSCGRKETV